MAVAVSLAAALLGISAVLPDLSQQALGRPGVDTLGSWWFQWWVDRALSEGSSLGHTDYQFFPWGKDMLLDTGVNVVDPLLAVPLRRLFGAVAAWNLLDALILAANGLVAGLLVRRHGAPLSGSLAACVVAALHPYTLFELQQGRPTQALVAPAVAALLVGVDSLFHGKGYRPAAIGGLLLAATGWVYWFGALFVVLALLLATVGALVRPGEVPRRQVPVRLAIIGGVSLVATAPVSVALLSALASGNVPGVLPTGEWMSSGLSLVTAAGDRIVMCTLGEGLQAGYLKEDTWTALGPACGLTVLVLVAAAGLKRPLWALVGALSLGLAVGPFPAGTANPLYIGLADLIPGMNRLYWPARAMVLLVPVAAVGAGELARRVPKRAGWALALVVALAVPTEAFRSGALPLSTWSTGVPHAYTCLSDTEGALIDLPYGRDHWGLVHQSVHNKKTLGGMNELSTALVPADQRRQRLDNSWLAAVLLAPANPRARQEWSEDDKQAMSKLGYRWISIRLDAVRAMTPGPAASQQVRAMLGRMEELAGPPVYRDETTAVFAPFGGEFICEVPR